MKDDQGTLMRSAAHPLADWGPEPIPATMPKRSLAARIAGRLIRSVRAAAGYDSFLRTEDRRVLEQIIIPHLLKDRSLQTILFVGCDWYTHGYAAWFKDKTYWTIEYNPAKRKYGAPRHIVDGLQNVARYFARQSVDAIICNGVFGWGLDLPADVEMAVRGCYEILRPGGLLVIGVDGVEERRPHALEQCRALLAFEPFVFPPLRTADYFTDTPYRHRFLFLTRPTERDGRRTVKKAVT